MTSESMIKALAELDDNKRLLRLIELNEGIPWTTMEAFFKTYKGDYLTSRDAIIALVAKVKAYSAGRSIRNHYRSFLIELFQICNPESKFEWDSEKWTNCLLATPHQLATALLKATDRYKE